jgi:hypothetical protein
LHAQEFGSAAFLIITDIGVANIRSSILAATSLRFLGSQGIRVNAGSEEKQ